MLSAFMMAQVDKLEELTPKEFTTGPEGKLEELMAIDFMMEAGVPWGEWMETEFTIPQVDKLVEPMECEECKPLCFSTFSCDIQTRSKTNKIMTIEFVDLTLHYISMTKNSAKLPQRKITSNCISIT
jgi:hypothetical protein